MLTLPHKSALPAVIAIILVGACSSSPTPVTSIGTDADPGIQPGDMVRVGVWREEDLTGEFVVDDRGIVTLPLLGERRVEGLHGPALREDLLSAYREYLQNPSIEVTVLRRVNVAGAVNEPGLYPVDATVSMSEVLGLAGGVSSTGDADDVRLVRNGRVIREGLGRTDVLDVVDVRSGDRLVVPEKSWVRRNPGALIGALIGTATAITLTLIR